MPTAVLVAEVNMSPLQGAFNEWMAGPLPLVQVANATTRQRGHARTTDEAARRTLVAAQPADALYGSGGAPVRFHRLGRRPVEDANPILAMELLQAPSLLDDEEMLTGWLAVHVAGPTKAAAAQCPLEAHRELMSEAGRRVSRAGNGLWEAAKALMPDGVGISASAHVRTLSFQALDPDNTANIPQSSLVAAYLLITAASPDQVSDMSRRALGHTLTIERPDWSALVLRDGAAFIAHQKSDEAFADTVRVLSHTVHLDAMLLALMQRGLVDASGARTVRASLKKPGELVDLERRHFDFKRNYWRTSLTDKRSSPSDDVLRAFQKELLTALDVADVQERVQDGARLARSLQAERQDHAQQQLNRMVQNTSITIGALGLTFTAAPVIANPSWRLFAIAGAAGVLAMALAFIILHLTGRRAGLHNCETPPRR